VSLSLVVMARKPLCSDDEIDSSIAVPRYPLRSNPGVVLVSPLHTPHRRGNKNGQRYFTLKLSFNEFIFSGLSLADFTTLCLNLKL
jgi:hypothetical protein